MKALFLAATLLCWPQSASCQTAFEVTKFKTTVVSGLLCPDQNSDGQSDIVLAVVRVGSPSSPSVDRQSILVLSSKDGAILGKAQLKSDLQQWVGWQMKWAASHKDGQHLLIVASPSRGDGGDVALLSLDSLRATRIVSAPDGSRCFGFSADLATGREAKDGILVVGSPSLLKRDEPGRVYLYAHNSDVPTRIIAEADLQGDSSSTAAYSFGTAVCRVPDFDGDGIEDVAISAPGSDLDPLHPGCVYIVSTATGVSKVRLVNKLGAAGFGSSVKLVPSRHNRAFVGLAVGIPSYGVEVFDAQYQSVGRFKGRREYDSLDGSGSSFVISAGQETEPMGLVGVIGTWDPPAWSLDGSPKPAWGAGSLGSSNFKYRIHDHAGDGVIVADMAINESGGGEVLFLVPTEKNVLWELHDASLLEKVVSAGTLDFD